MSRERPEDPKELDRRIDAAVKKSTRRQPMRSTTPPVPSMTSSAAPITAERLGRAGGPRSRAKWSPPKATRDYVTPPYYLPRGR